MSEMVDENFQWKYGASNIIFIKADVYNMEQIEEFAVNYAKFPYEHQIDGTHRINIIAYFPDIEIRNGYCHLWYDEVKANVGFYCFSFNSLRKRVIMDSTVFSTDENELVITHNNNPLYYETNM